MSALPAENGEPQDRLLDIIPIPQVREQGLQGLQEFQVPKKIKMD